MKTLLDGSFAALLNTGSVKHDQIFAVQCSAPSSNIPTKCTHVLALLYQNIRIQNQNANIVNSISPSISCNTWNIAINTLLVLHVIKRGTMNNWSSSFLGHFTNEKTIILPSYNACLLSRGRMVNWNLSLMLSLTKLNQIKCISLKALSTIK